MGIGQGGEVDSVAVEGSIAVGEGAEAVSGAAIFLVKTLVALCSSYSWLGVRRVPLE